MVCFPLAVEGLELWDIHPYVKEWDQGLRL